MKITDTAGNVYEGTLELVKVSKTRKQSSLRKKAELKKPTPLKSVKLLYNKNFFRVEKSLSQAVTKLKSKGINLDG